MKVQYINRKFVNEDHRRKPITWGIANKNCSWLMVGRILFSWPNQLDKNLLWIDKNGWPVERTF